MKTIKKFITVMATAIVACAVPLGACGSGNPSNDDGNKHIHNYSTKWSFDESYHWNDCQIKDCTEPKGNKAVHNDQSDDGKCDACNYVTDNLKGKLLEFKINSDGSFSVGAVKKKMSGDLYDKTTEPFGDLKLPKYYKHSKVTAIVEQGFYNCIGLTAFPASDDIKSVGNYAFYGCEGLKEVTVPDSVVSIGNCAFSSCKNLTKAVIGSNVAEIGDGIFDSCSKLKNITVSINNSVYHSKDGILYDNNGIICIPDAISGVITVSEKIGQIKASAFSNVEGITKVTVPGNIQKIGYRAFFQCYGINSVVLESGVEQIDSLAFEQCSTLKSIYIPTSVTKVNGQAFEGCKNLTVTYEGTTEQWKDAKDGTFSIPSYVNVVCLGDNS